MMYVDTESLETLLDTPFNEPDRAKVLEFLRRPTVRSRLNWRSFAEVAALAARLNEKDPQGPRYLPVDQGGSCHPRFDIIIAPKVGDPVSYAFNGDYYPDGVITRISESCRVVATSGGHVYFRRKATSSWIQAGGTWRLVQGHRSDKNMEF